MRQDRSRAWRALWDRRGDRAVSVDLTEGEDRVLGHLLATDGCEAGPGRLTPRGWQAWVERAVALLALEPHHLLLDSGCGAGPWLHTLGRRGVRCVGVDYSPKLLRVAREYVPSARVVVAEAGRLPLLTGSVDRVLCSGVFMYFSDLQYARSALHEMLRVCGDGGRVLIMDVPDLARQQTAEQQRARPSDRQHASSDPALSHLYYPRSFFQAVAAEAGVTVEIHDQAIPDYGNGPFRFNILLQVGAGREVSAHLQ
jgi:SAM-dependent methyltransferase